MFMVVRTPPSERLHVIGAPFIVFVLRNVELLYRTRFRVFLLSHAARWLCALLPSPVILGMYQFSGCWPIITRRTFSGLNFVVLHSRARISCLHVMHHLVVS